MKNPISRYMDWLIAKSIDTEMKGGKWNGFKGIMIIILGVILPIFIVLGAINYFLPPSLVGAKP